MDRVYARLPLIADSEGGLLAQVSKSLIVVGYDPLYAGDLGELMLHAGELRGQVGALLLPAVHAFARWPVVRKRVVEPLGLAPCSVLPVGALLAQADAQALHDDGLRWALAGPFTPLELRFAVSMVLSESDPDEIRLETRVPCAIPVEVESHSHAIPAQLTDLSTGGAFIELAQPHPEGTPIELRGALGGRAVSLQARVVWRTSSHTPSWRDRGMGVGFERIELATLDPLRQEMNRALDRFRIRARENSEQPRSATAAID